MYLNTRSAGLGGQQVAMGLRPVFSESGPGFLMLGGRAFHACNGQGDTLKVPNPPKVADVTIVGDLVTLGLKRQLPAGVSAIGT